MLTVRNLLALLAVILLAVGNAWAQSPAKPMIFELHGGINVPTFDITDLAKAGGSFGAGFGYAATEKVYLIAEADFGFHGGADSDDPEVTYADVDVSHYMGKVGYVVHEGTGGKLKILLNAGLGLMAFKADVEEAETNSYFAINAGAKFYYLVGENIGLVFSPQGDIAFVDENDGFTGGTAWIWPFSAGVYFNF
jgi:hypothetical protein